MFTKPESPALRALLWVLAVLLPGGFLLLPFLGADVVRRRLRQEPVAVNDSEEAPPSAARDSEPPEITETRERSSCVTPKQDVAESTPPAPRAAA
jgi:hypothetical protein